jgi:hypothetical protein
MRQDSADYLDLQVHSCILADSSLPISRHVFAIDWIPVSDELRGLQMPGRSAALSFA